MKKKYLSLKSLLVLLILFSCQKGENITGNKTIQEKINFKSGIREILTESILKSGVYKLEAKSENNTIIYTPTTANTVTLNGQKVDFANFIFILQNEKLTLDVKYSLSFKENELFLESPLFTGFLKDGKDGKVIDSKTAALLLIYSEISNNSSNQSKMSYSNYLTKIDIVSNPIFKESKSKYRVSDEKILNSGNLRCGLNVAVELGWSRESTSAELAEELSESTFYSGCRKIGGISTSCLADEHFCVSTQVYKCPCY
jgi:hypothetical protein